MSELLTVSYTQIKRWRLCSQAYYYNYVEGIVPRIKSKPLKLGNITHQAIEEWAKIGNISKLLKSVDKEYGSMFEEERELYGNIPDTIRRIMKGYLSMHSGERLKYKVVEEKLGPVPLTKRTQLSLKVDRLTETKAGLTLCETKTAKRIPGEDMRIWDLQTILYVWALRQLGYPVKAILWDYIRTKPPTIPKVLKDGSLSKKEIDTDYETYLAAVKEVCPDLMDEYQPFLDKLKLEGNKKFFKRVLLPVNNKMIEPVLNDAKMTSLQIASFQHLPVRNISGFTCPRCFYGSLCLAGLRGQDEAFIREHEFMNKEEEIEYGSEEEEETEE